jgi:nucleoside-triphosphatase THEP1
MTNYDFKSVNDKEFEAICCDLLGESFGVRIERFKAGKDRGIDGRFFSTSGGQTILQCKHWAGTPFNALLKSLRESERPKLLTLKPRRYLFATSQALSADNKTKIAEALAPFVKRADDIYGAEDLNDLLGEYPDVERRHYKLWLASSAVLGHLMNHPIYERSRFTLSEATDFINRYVVTSHHGDALKHMKNMHVLLITGEPGVGKTTLAKQLCLQYAAKGKYELAVIATSIKEAEAIWDDKKKQLFYFDDFLGRNYLQALTGHEGSHIAQFIKRVQRAKNKRFVLTSRSTILNQGKTLIDSFDHVNLQRSEFELTVTRLKPLEKAQILYNHLWHSNLPREYIDQLYVGKRYRSVIEHQNFNPRLIEFVSDHQRLTAVKPLKYWAHVETLLENPSTVWEHPFNAQLDDCGRTVVLLVTVNGGRIEESELQEAFQRYLASPDASGLSGPRDFDLLAKHLVGSLLNRSIRAGSDIAMYSLFNPSIGDYVLQRYVGLLPSIRLAVDSLRTDSSIKTIKDIHTAKILPTGGLDKLLATLLRLGASVSFENYPLNFVVALAATAIKTGFLERNNSIARGGLKEAVRVVIANVQTGDTRAVCEVCVWALTEHLASEQEVRSILSNALDESQTLEEIQSLIAVSNVVNMRGTQGRVLRESLRERAIDTLAEDVEFELEYNDVLSDVDDQDYEGGRASARGYVETRLERIGMGEDDGAVDEILSRLPLRRLLDSREAEPTTPRKRAQPSRSPRKLSLDEIDDLFEQNLPAA